MKPSSLAIGLFCAWLFAFAASFAIPFFVEPTGDGFTRGWNRIGAWLLWQGAALVLAVAAAVNALVRHRSQKTLKLLSLAPLACELLLIVGILGLILYLRLSKPEPQSEAPLPTTSEAAPLLQPE